MSIALVDLAMRLRLKDPTEKLVLVAFSQHADDDGLSFPSVSLVAAEALCSDRTAQRIIRRFEDIGLLQLYRRASGRGYPATYRVHPEALGPVAEYAELRGAQRDKSHPPPVSTDPPAEFPQRDLLPVDNSEKGDTRVSPIPPVDNSQKGDKSGKRGDKSGLKGDSLVSPEPRTFNHKERALARPVDNSRTSRPRDRPDLSPPVTHSQQSKKQPHKDHYVPDDYRDSIDQVEEKARQHAIEPRKQWEDDFAFRNRVNVSIADLSILGNEARRLHIKDRQPDETVEDFEHRVTRNALLSEGMESDLSPEEARRQALGLP